MTTPQTDQSIDQNDEDLDFVRSIRKDLITRILPAKGDKIEDAESLNMAQKLLADMDRAALGRKRIKSEDKVNGATAGAMAVIAELAQFHNVKNIPEATTKREAAPSLEAGLVDVQIKDGELEPGQAVENYNTFMSRVGQ